MKRCLLFLAALLFAGCSRDLSQIPSQQAAQSGRVEQSSGLRTIETFDLDWLSSASWYQVDISEDQYSLHSHITVLLKDGRFKQIRYIRFVTVSNSNAAPQLLHLRDGKKETWVLRGPVGLSKTEFEVAKTCN